MHKTNKYPEKFCNLQRINNKQLETLTTAEIVKIPADY